MDQPKVNIIRNVLYSNSLYFLHSRKCFFCTHPLEDPYIINSHIDAFFLFLLQQDFYIVHKHICTFCLFIFPKNFGAFHELLFETFLCFFENNYLPFLYIEKKKLQKNIF